MFHDDDVSFIDGTEKTPQLANKLIYFPGRILVVEIFEFVYVKACLNFYYRFVIAGKDSSAY